MLTIFGIWRRPVDYFIINFLGSSFAIYIFIKFCSWAKNFQLSGQIKKVIYILTGVGLIVFNIIYSKELISYIAMIGGSYSSTSRIISSWVLPRIALMAN